jgi:siroheme synthase
MAHSLLTPIRRAEDLFDKDEEIITLAASDSVLLVAKGLIRFTVVPGAGATVTISKVDSAAVTSHDTETDVAVATETTYDVAWPYYLISTAGGTARVGVI